MTPAALLGHLVDAHSVKLGAVEVGVAAQAGFHARLHEGTGQGVDGAQVGNVQRASDAVVLRRPALLVLRLLEIGEDGGEVPPLVAGIVPAVVVVGMASDIDHRVDGAGSPSALPRGQ